MITNPKLMEYVEKSEELTRIAYRQLKSLLIVETESFKSLLDQSLCYLPESFIDYAADILKSFTDAFSTNPSICSNFMTQISFLKMNH